MRLRGRAEISGGQSVGRFVDRVPDLATWDTICHRASVGLPGAETVKVVVDRRSGDGAEAMTPYFLQTRRYQHHVDFCRELDPRSNKDFDEVMYRGADRPFVLLTMTRLPGARQHDDLWWVEMWPGDTLATEQVAEVVELLRASAVVAAPLSYKASSSQQRQRLAQAGPVVARRLEPVVDHSEIYRGVDYQALTTGTAWGRLRIARDVAAPGTDLADVTPYDVLVTDAVPLDVGPVAGLVTGEHQTPLAHVAVLSENRGSPNCAIVGADRRPEVVQLEGRWVTLEVASDGWRLEACEEREARARCDARLAALRAGAPQVQTDLRHRALVDVDDRRQAVPRVGAKSAGLSVQRRRRAVRPYVVPGFTVPTAWYADHVTRHAADELQAVHATAAGRGDVSSREALAALRDAIERAPVSDELITRVQTRLSELRPTGGWEELGGHGVMVRSSSNCEDLPGFNGAGLAESTRVRDPLDAEALASGLRRVWASLWSHRGHAERQTFGIDQDGVAMAVLVQPFVPHDAHVVAVTTNTVRPGAVGACYLNLLPSGGLVTDAATDEAEQLLLFDDDPPCAEILCLAAGQTESLLPDDRVEEVQRLLRAAERGVRRAAGDPTLAADVELLVLRPGGPRGFALLQARPYRGG